MDNYKAGGGVGDEATFLYDIGVEFQAPYESRVIYIGKSRNGLMVIHGHYSSPSFHGWNQLPKTFQRQTDSE